MRIDNNQTKEIDSESYRYISSYIDEDLKDEFFFPKNRIDADCVEKILEVGCGTGQYLNAWKNKYSASKAIGIEPSIDGVNLLNNKWKNEAGLDFQSAFAHNLPFEADMFDVVITSSVLHWIGRNEYLQSLGELVRVCKKYLCVMDFVASKNYRVKYQHKEGLYTYKQDFEPIITACGIMKPIEVLRFWCPNTHQVKYEKLKESELKPFEGNVLSYHARKMVIFEKDYNLLPVKKEDDFI